MKLTREAFTIVALATCAMSALAQGPNDRNRHQDSPARQPQSFQRPAERPTFKRPAEPAPSDRRPIFNQPIRSGNPPATVRNPFERPTQNQPNRGSNQVTISRGHQPNLGNYRQDSQAGHLQIHGNRVPQDSRWGNTWRDDRSSEFSIGFHFSSYVYSPFDASAYISPWYDYLSVPAYIPASCVTVEAGYRCDWNEGTYYSVGGFDAGLNNSIDAINTAFANQDPDAMGQLLPGSDQVAIFDGGQYQYSIAGNEFLSTLQDTVSSTNTLSFTLNSVNRYTGGAVIHATQVVQNGDGSQETILQTYHLRQIGGGQYEISDFMTTEA